MNSIHTTAFTCSLCAKTFTDKNVADRCCTCTHCGNPVDKKAGDYDHLHRACRDLEHRALEAKRFEAAERVESCEGYVYCDVASPDDGFFTDVDALIEHLCELIAAGDMTENGIPTHCYCTEPRRHTLDVEDIIENLCSDGYEDMDDSVNGVEALRAAVDAFNAANTHLISHHPDYKRIIVLDRAAVIAAAKGGA